MKRSKHFRKDVILARVIFAILVIVIGVLIGIGVSSLTKDKDNDDTQQTESQQTEEYDIPQYEETEVEIETETEVEVEVEEVVVYAKTTAQVRLRKEPNTNCEVVTSVPSGTKTLMLEEADGWYKVSYNGQEGYIRADYVEIVEETVSPDETGNE